MNARRAIKPACAPVSAVTLKSGCINGTATAKKRGTERHLAEAVDVLNEVESSPVMQKLWESYRRKFSYAADLEWNIIMRAVRSLYALCEKESSL